jgi:hypothetical protein
VVAGIQLVAEEGEAVGATKAEAGMVEAVTVLDVVTRICVMMNWQKRCVVANL